MARIVGEAGVKVVPDAEGFGDDASDQIGPGLNEMTSESGAIGMFTKRVAGMLAAAFAIDAVKDFAVESVNTFGEFDRGMNEVFTLLPGESEAAFDTMRGDVQTFAGEFGVLTSDVVPALYQALSAGVPQGGVFDFLETAQKASLGGATDLETAVDGISSVVNAYGVENMSAAEASDIMFTTVKNGKTTFDELSNSLFNVTPTAAALGVGFEDIGAALATMTAQGIPTSVATTQLRQMFVELSREGTVVSDTFKDVTGKSFVDFIAGGGNVADALGVLTDHAADTDTAVQDMFGSVEGGAAVLALTSSASFVRNIDDMASSAGATEAAYEQMDQGVSRAMDRMGVQWELFKIRVGEALAPIVEAVLTWAMEDLPAVVDAIKTFVADAEEFLRPFVENIIAQVEAVVTIFDGLIDFITAVWTGDWDAAWQAILQIFEGVWDLIVAVVEGVWLRLKLALDIIIAGVRALWDWSFLSDWIGDAWDAVIGFFLNAPARLANAWVDIHAKVFEIATGIFNTLVDWAGRAIQGVMDFFLGLPARIFAASIGIIASAASLGLNILRSMVAGLSGLGQALVDLIRAAWDRAVGFFRSLNPINFAEKIPVIGGVIGGAGDVLSGIGGSLSGAFDMFGDGGRPTVGRPSIVGERGIELFWPDTAGTIVPNNALGSFGGDQIVFGAGSIVVNLASGSAKDADRAGRIIRDHVATSLALRRQRVNERISA